jgi:methylated-DNA-[protein]-cysteine S-methyltransferase
MPLYFYNTQIGRIGIEEHYDSIVKLYFENDLLPESVEVKTTALLDEAARQLEAYLAGQIKVFSVPLKPIGTEFRQTLWQHLCNIPYGQTVSYKALAIAVDNPKASRAVGQANNKNPIPIFIPCHRVIGANGKLVGYRGGLVIKEQLLRLERQNARSC